MVPLPYNSRNVWPLHLTRSACIAAKFEPDNFAPVEQAFQTARLFAEHPPQE